MANQLMGGDYPVRGTGNVRLTGADAAFADALFRLQCRRGSFPFLPELGSRLWELGLVRSGDRAACARQYCLEALAGSGVEARNVTVSEQGQALLVGAELRLGENSISVEVSV